MEPRTDARPRPTTRAGHGRPGLRSLAKALSRRHRAPAEHPGPSPVAGSDAPPMEEPVAAAAGGGAGAPPQGPSAWDGSQPPAAPDGGPRRFLLCLPRPPSPRVRSRALSCLVLALSALVLVALCTCARPAALGRRLTRPDLGLTLSKTLRQAELSIMIVLVILALGAFFLFSAVRLWLVLFRPDPEDRREALPPEMVGPGRYMVPPKPIPVVLARDEEAAGTEGHAVEAMPPAYGLWRESVVGRRAPRTGTRRVAADGAPNNRGWTRTGCSGSAAHGPRRWSRRRARALRRTPPTTASRTSWSRGPGPRVRPPGRRAGDDAGADHPPRRAASPSRRLGGAAEGTLRRGRPPCWWLFHALFPLLRGRRKPGGRWYSLVAASCVREALAARSWAGVKASRCLYLPNCRDEVAEFWQGKTATRGGACRLRSKMGPSGPQGGVPTSIEYGMPPGWSGPRYSFPPLACRPARCNPCLYGRGSPAAGDNATTFLAACDSLLSDSPGGHERVKVRPARTPSTPRARGCRRSLRL